MRSLIYNLLLASSAACVSVLLSACVLPYHFDEAPAVAGQVTDSVTNRPVAGATVSMTTDKKSVRTVTDQAGSFSLPEIAHWGLIPYPTDGWVGHIGTLRIEAAGYGTYTGERFGLDPSFRGRDLEHVHLTLTPGA